MNYLRPLNRLYPNQVKFSLIQLIALLCFSILNLQHSPQFANQYSASEFELLRQIINTTTTIGIFGTLCAWPWSLDLGVFKWDIQWAYFYLTNMSYYPSKTNVRLVKSILILLALLILMLTIGYSISILSNFPPTSLLDFVWMVSFMVIFNCSPLSIIIMTAKLVAYPKSE